MLKRHTFRVESQDGKWTVRFNGYEVGSRRLFLKQSAIEDARALALANQPSEVLVEENDGECRTIGLYGIPNLQAAPGKTTSLTREDRVAKSRVQFLQGNPKAA